MGSTTRRQGRSLATRGPAVARKHRLRLTFDDPDLEREFRAAHDRDSVATARFAALLGVALYAAFGILDTQVVDEGLSGLLLMRAAVIVVIAIGGALTYHSRFPQFQQPVVCSTVLVSGLGMASMPVIAPVPDAMAAMGTMLTLMFLFSFVRVRFVPAAITAAVMIAAWEAGLLLSDKSGLTILYLNFELVGFLVVGLAASHTLERLWRENYVRGLQIAAAAVSTERKRIERDLHDGAQQQLINAALMVQLAKSQLDGANEPVAQLLAGSVERLQSGLAELRDLSRGVYPILLNDFGLVAAVESLALRSAVPVELEVNGLPRFDEQVEVTAYFVVAEALANVLKHAGATCATVAIDHDGQDLRVSIADDGVGAADASGSGLRGLRERVGALGGQLWITSPSGAGTTLAATFPATARTEEST